ncbi:MAG: hypothetical protein ACU84Q_20760 [Gammaproteobacteria bacterium]
MKFAHNGYYIEKYIKCDNCGLLIYGDGIKPGSSALGDEIYCSNWCREWRAEKHQGVASPEISIDFVD